MAVTPYRTSNDPFDRLFDSLWGASGGGNRGGSLMRAPETDVVETEKEIRVVTEMPGLKPDDVEVDVENNVLTIRGEKREERTEGEAGGKYHLAERRYGTFARSFVLPRDVDAERIEAGFEHGVLTVRIPKSERAQRRRIQVGGSGSQEQGVSMGNGNSQGAQG
ncbi:MAG TPA: Hsp20/alpha crystallin family protein [Longimicrobiaceae bacterium]|jgi:HSP20 family protein